MIRLPVLHPREQRPGLGAIALGLMIARHFEKNLGIVRRQSELCFAGGVSGREITQLPRRQPQGPATIGVSRIGREHTRGGHVIARIAQGSRIVERCLGFRRVGGVSRREQPQRRCLIASELGAERKSEKREKVVRHLLQHPPKARLCGIELALLMKRAQPLEHPEASR